MSINADEAGVTRRKLVVDTTPPRSAESLASRAWPTFDDVPAISRDMAPAASPLSVDSLRSLHHRRTLLPPGEPLADSRAELGSGAGLCSAAVLAERPLALSAAMRPLALATAVESFFFTSRGRRERPLVPHEAGSEVAAPGARAGAAPPSGGELAPAVSAAPMHGAGAPDGGIRGGVASSEPAAARGGTTSFRFVETLPITVTWDTYHASGDSAAPRLRLVGWHLFSPYRLADAVVGGAATPGAAAWRSLAEGRMHFNTLHGLRALGGDASRVEAHRDLTRRLAEIIAAGARGGAGRDIP